MLVSEKDYLNLHHNRDSPVQETIRFFPKLADQKLLKGKACSFWCDARKCFMSLFVCLLHCPEGNEASYCSIIPENLQGYIVPLIELWNDTLQKIEKGETITMKKLIKKAGKAIVTAKKDDALMTYKETVNNGTFQDVIKGIASLLDTKLMPIISRLDTLQANFRVTSDRVENLVKVTSMLAAENRAINESMKGKKAVAEKQETEREENHVAGKRGRKPVSKTGETLSELIDRGIKLDDIESVDQLFEWCEKQADARYQRAQFDTLLKTKGLVD